MPKHLVPDVVVVVAEEAEVAEPAAAGTVGGATVVDMAVVETVDVTVEVDTEDNQTGRLNLPILFKFLLG